MAVSRNFSAVIEVVEHAELQCEFVLVGSDVLAVHGQRRIAIADFQIAENLIVGAVFLEHVDDVLDRIPPAGKGNSSGVAVKEVVPLDRVRELRKLLQGGGNVQARDRTSEQAGDVGVLVAPEFGGGLTHLLVGPGALPLGSGDEKVAAMDSQRTGIPIRRNKTQSRLRCLRVGTGARRPGVEHRDRIQRRSGCEQIFAIRGLCERSGIGARELLRG